MGRPPGEAPGRVSQVKSPTPFLVPRTSNGMVTSSLAPIRRRTSSSAGCASSARTATAPGPRAAAGGGGGRRTPLCTRPSQPSSGPRAGPPWRQPAWRGSGPPSWPASPRPTSAAGPGGAPASRSPASPTPERWAEAPVASAPGDPRPPGSWSGASQGLRWIRGSRAAQSRGSAPSAGRAGGRPGEPVHALPLGAGAQQGCSGRTPVPLTQTLAPLRPCGRFGARTPSRSTKEHHAPSWRRVNVCERRKGGGTRRCGPHLGSWGSAGSALGSAPSSWRPAPQYPAPGTQQGRQVGTESSHPVSPPALWGTAGLTST